jgi:hypothetical protein
MPAHASRSSLFDTCNLRSIVLDVHHKQLGRRGRACRARHNPTQASVTGIEPN